MPTCRRPPHYSEGMTNPLLDVNSRLVVAHRGNSIGAPENTLESLRQGVALGADAIEFDVRMTRDGVTVVFHDAELNRTTDGVGPVNRRTFDELRLLNAGGRFSRAGSDPYRVPSLEEVLDEFRRIPLIIEVKEFAAVESTERLVRKFDAQDRVLVGSSNDAVMARFYRSGLAACASMRDAALLIPQAMLGIRPARPRYDVLSLTPEYRGVPIPIAKMAAAVRSRGIPTHVWTVNDPVEAGRFWDAGVNAILTDDPGAILRTRPN